MGLFASALLGGLGSGLASSAISTGTSLLGNLLGTSMSQSEAMEKQQEYNKELMGLQYEYQSKAAEQEQQYAKDYWDYTNYENQVQHLKNAGLNTALLYSQGGSSGSTGGAGVSGNTDIAGNPVAMGLQVQQMQQEKRLQDAQIAATLAQADKTKAEADKTRGVDTLEGFQRIETMKTEIDSMRQGIQESISRQDLNGAQASLAESSRLLNDATRALRAEEENLTRQNYNNAMKQWQILDQEYMKSIESVEQAIEMTKQMKADTRMKTTKEKYFERELKSMIEEREANRNLMIKKAIEVESNVELNRTQQKSLNAQMDKWAKETENFTKITDAQIERIEGELTKWAIENGINISKEARGWVTDIISALNPIKASK